MLLALCVAALAQPEVRTETLEIHGRTFAAWVYTPAGVAAGEPRKVVVAFHGLGADGVGMANAWLRLAGEHGFILVAPVVPEVGDWFTKPDVLDPALFERWRGWAVDHGGDPGQVYAVGFSMGAHYTAGLVCSGVELAGAGVIGMSMVDAMEQRCTGRPTPIAYVVSAEDRFATPGPLQITGLSVTLTSQEQTWDRFRTLDACEALGEPKLLKAAKTWEPSCTKAPLWIAQVPGSTHAMRPRGFDTIRAIWAFWERSAKR